MIIRYALQNVGIVRFITVMQIKTYACIVIIVYNELRTIGLIIMQLRSCNAFGCALSICWLRHHP